MSKGKNNNKNNNKSNKMPVKAQPMKQQKPAVNKFVKEIKPNQVNNKSVQKTNGKQQVEVNKKVEKKDNKAPKVKDVVKVVDIADSEDDEDEDDVDFDEMDDSDIDDVSIGDSDEDDMSDDDEDLSIEDIDNSDYESVDLNEDNLDKDSEEEEEEEKVEVPKKLSKKEKKELNKKLAEIKEDVKIVKKDEVIVEKKEEAKVEKKEEVKVVKKEEAKVEKVEKVKVEKQKKEEVKAKVIDPSTPEGKILTEMNQRKNFLNDYVVFVGKLDKTVTRQTLLDSLASVSVVHINLPSKTKNKQLTNRGYGFIRLATTGDVAKAIEILTAKDINATKFVCKKVFDDVNKVDFNKLIVNSYKNEDISELLKRKFNESTKVIKYMTTQYAMELTNASDAMALFNQHKMTIDGTEVQFTFFYSLKSIKVDNAVPEASATLPLKTETVKAGVKRAACESEEEEEEVAVKKSKVVEEAQAPRAVATPKKAAAKPAQQTPENKKPVEKTTPKEEKKSVTPNKNFNKGGDKKSPGNNKNFHKGGDKKSPGNNKNFNKGGNKKPFNKK